MTTPPSDARSVLDAAMTEAEYQEQIVGYAQIRGWSVYHTRNSKGSVRGYPDLCMVRVMPDNTARLVYLEVKKIGGRVTMEQLEWIGNLNAVPGVIAMVVTPADFESVMRVLD